VAFLNENPPPLILDEVQYVPSLLPYINERVDEDRRPGTWLMTGSQGFGLMRGVSESLAGRVAVLTLDPMAVGEGVIDEPPPSIDEMLDKVFGDGASGLGEAPLRVSLADWILRGGTRSHASTPKSTGSFGFRVISRSTRRGMFGRFPRQEISGPSSGFWPWWPHALERL